MTRRELKLQKQIVEHIAFMGGAARICAQTGLTTVGDGDVYGCLCGIMLYFEVKDGFEYEVSKIQQHRLMEWWDAGAWAYVIHNMEEANAILNTVSSHSALRLWAKRNRPLTSNAAPVRDGKDPARPKKR